MKISFITIVFLLQIFFVAAQNDTVINPRYNVIENSDQLTMTLNKLKNEKSNSDSGFVVAHFGDSHIEGDFLTGVIRKNLQEVFRSGGEGILFPYAVCKGYGPKSLSSTISGEWDCANLVKNPNKYPIGITGHTLVTTDKKATISFVYNPTNEVDYEKNKVYEKVLIWHSAKNFKLMLVNNGSADGIFFDSTKTENGLCCTIIMNYHVGTELKLKFDTTDANAIFNFHGISFENPSLHGLEYNRCGTIGATFLQLVDDQEFTLTQLHQIKPDLLIFSYGSNECYDTNFSIDNYYNKVSHFIKRIKKEFPNINIIFTDTPDTRSRNKIPPNTNAINEKLKQIAIENNSGFWDLNKIMGGKNSMFYWLANGLAGKDKLHFTKKGYELQGNLFSFAFLEIYNERFNKCVQISCDSLQEQIHLQLEELTSKNIDSSSTSNSSSQNYQIHLVQKNETLSSIAKKYGVTTQQLCKLNNLTEKSVLHLNQKIMIPKK